MRGALNWGINTPTRDGFYAVCVCFITVGGGVSAAGDGVESAIRSVGVVIRHDGAGAIEKLEAAALIVCKCIIERVAGDGLGVALNHGVGLVRVRLEKGNAGEM